MENVLVTLADPMDPRMFRRWQWKVSVPFGAWAGNLSPVDLLRACRCLHVPGSRRDGPCVWVCRSHPRLCNTISIFVPACVPGSRHRVRDVRMDHGRPLVSPSKSGYGHCSIDSPMTSKLEPCERLRRIRRRTIVEMGVWLRRICTCI